jgi:hypothetical protein
VWQTVRNNGYQQVTATGPFPGLNYLPPFDALLATLPFHAQRDNPELTFFGQEFQPARVQNSFVGVEREITRDISVEANVLYSRSDNAITTDRMNRQNSVPPRDFLDQGRLQPDLPDLLYRANQGMLRYRALALRARGQHSGMRWQASYTYSHTKDNQSDPVLGELFDLSFSGVGLTNGDSFTQQFTPSGDWGNADYDQRHNFVFFWLWTLPRALRNWEITGIGAVRSGFPFTVIGPSPDGTSFIHDPADLVNPALVDAGHEPVDGGVRLLRAEAFAPGPSDRIGNSGRNAFYGPGLFNLDASIIRRFHPRWLGESGEWSIRLTAFNVLNHANLGSPQNLLQEPDFGIALKGTDLRPNGFQVFEPLAQSARQLQIRLRIQF